MIELGWLGAAGKMLGAAVVGWLGRVVTERNKRRKMRKHLYKEIAENYARVSHAMARTDEPLYALPANMDFSYWEYALRDMDTFHSLEDYVIIRSLYKGYQLVSKGTDYVPVFQEATKANQIVSSFLALQDSTGKNLLKYAPGYARNVMLDGAMAILLPTDAKIFWERFRGPKWKRVLRRLKGGPARRISFERSQQPRQNA